MNLSNIKDFLVSAQGKKHNQSKSILDPSTTTIKLRTGSVSKFLGLDVDNPYSPTAQRLLKYIDGDDFLIYSSQYTVDDVLKGRCRFKVIYTYDGEDIPKKKTPTHARKDVELFYNKAGHTLLSIAGKREDGYEYLFTKKKPKPLFYDLVDIYQEKVDKFRFGKESKKAKDKRELQEEKEETSPLYNTPSELEEVDINEFSTITSNWVGHLPLIEKKGELLTFECLFPHTHTSKNHGYAWKHQGIYQARCFGQVCQHEYDDLNKKFKNYHTKELKFTNINGFEGLNPYGVNVFLASTGWGKTETIAQEILIAIQEKRKVLVLMQSKEAMERLLDRVNHYSGGYRELLEDSGQIFKYTSEEKMRVGEDFANVIEKANVIVSHHDYFKNAGGVITYFKSSFDILNLDRLEIIIDEAHTYLEKATRLDLEIGGAYTTPYGDYSNRTLVTNNASLTKQDFLDSGKYQIMTKCIETKFTGYGTLELQRQYKILTQEAFGVDSETNQLKETPYLDIYNTIKNRFKLFKEFEENNFKYKIFKNSNVLPIKPNLLDEQVSLTEGMDLMLDSAEEMVVAINQGDDYKRKQIGTITLSLYHSQIIKKVLSASKVILTSATMMEYHYDILQKFGNFFTKEVITPVAKVGHIILLKSNDTKSSRPRNSLFEMAQDFANNEMDTRFLFFLPTLDKCREELGKYHNTMMNDNGRYTIGKRKNVTDYVDNVLRNVTLVGLEASPSKGYNYLEEIAQNSLGFEFIYFDKSPVSPQIIKKYFNADGDLVDHSSDYNISTFSQAIGRAFRKDKKTLTIALNNIEEETYQMIKQYLEETTTAKVVEAELTMSNAKVSINSWVENEGLSELKNRLRKNKLFREIYLDMEENENE